MKTQCIVPVFMVKQLDDALWHYKEVLQFTEDFRFGQYVGVRLGEASIHLCGHNAQNRPYGGGAAYLFCDGVDAYYAEVRQKGAKIYTEIGDRPYGLRDFTVQDPDGNLLNFGCESSKPGMSSKD